MDSNAGYWQMGITGLLDVAGSGLLGSKVKKIVNPNPPTAISYPASAPPPAPVAGQLSVNPPPSDTRGHFEKHWPKYAVGAALLAVAAFFVLRRK
jgi:hypothetical protein